MATYSFYGNKIFTCGEGGAITLSDPQLDLRARTLRGQGMDPQRRYYFPVTGHNFRLTNIACAILCAQLERREEIMAKRRHIYSAYRALLTDVPGMYVQPVAPWAELSPWLFCARVNMTEYGRSRDELAALLDENGIETRPFFIPLHKLPPFREESAGRGEHLPITDQLSESGINLPTFNQMTDAEIEYICAVIRKSRK
jgi:perosamine synthetase